MESVPEHRGSTPPNGGATGSPPPQVGVILANWNAAEFTTACIESLLKSDYGNFHIIVVDDASTDGSPDKIAERFPEVDLIRQPANRGVSAARNQGIARALELASDYVLFLDNDTIVDGSLLTQLVAGAERYDHRVAVGPKIYYLRDPNRLWFAYGRLSLWTGIYANPIYNSLDHGQYDQETEMDAASSCCLLVPAAIVRVVGGFDSRYTWNEDVDWSLRCRRSGFRLVYLPGGKVWHFGGASSRKQPQASIRYFLTRNQLWTLRRIASPWQMASIALIYPFRALLRIGFMAVRGQWDGIPAELRGAQEGFFAPLAEGDPDHVAPPHYRNPFKEKREMGFIKRLTYRPELTWLARLLHIRPIANWIYFRSVAPRGIVTIEVKGIKARFYVKAPGEVRSIEGVTLGGGIPRGEREILEALMDTLRGGGVCYDVGANFGVFSVLLGKVLGEKGQVIAFEPDTRNFERLQQNLKLNQVDNVQCIRKALSDRSGQATLFVSKEEPTISSLSTHPGSGSEASEVVEIIEGDRLVAEERLPIPLAVKIDVEGHEASVVQGLQKTLSHPGCKLVMLEIHLSTWMPKSESKPILDLMRSLGFQQIQTFPRGYQQHAICRKTE